MSPHHPPDLEQAAAEPTLAAALDLCNDAVAILAAGDGEDLWCNAAFGQMAEKLGVTEEGLLEKLSELIPLTAAAPANQTSEFLIDDQTLGELRLRMQSVERNGQRSLVLALGALRASYTPTPPALTHDVVTDLPDRRSLERVLARRFADSTRPFALFFVDLNGFKQVNDSLGHLAGDHILHEVARRFRDALRDDDLVGRYGGDEFVVIAEGVGNQAAAEPIVARLELAVAEPMPEANGLVVAASIGVALSRDNYATPEAMVHAADRQMYDRKRSED